MDKNNLLAMVALVAISISLFLSVFLITVKTKLKLSNSLFAFFLILTAIDISINLGAVFEIPLNIRVFISSFFFLQLPVFYLYVLSVCYTDFKLKLKHLLHLFPFILANLILVPRFYAVNQAAKISFLGNSLNMPEIQFNHFVIHAQIILYIIAVFITLRKVRTIYLENYAGSSIESLTWLTQFTIALSIFFIIALLKNIFKFSQYPYLADYLKIGLILFELAIIFWYLYKALNNPGLFKIIDSKLTLFSETVLEDKKLHSSASFESKNSTELLSLKNYMMEKKPFLNPSLTIQDVSSETNIPVRDLSALINLDLGQHFYDFVNTYRINQAKEILKDNTKIKLTILEILYQVGFNSKSSFNTAFKKQTGHTPTDYRKKLLNK